MKNIGPGDGTGSIYFGADSQTFYVKQADIDFVHKMDTANDGPGDPNYAQADLGLPEWGIRHATTRKVDSKLWKANYRRCCTANAWNGYVLAARMINAQKLWAHDALFDYMDRYMAETLKHNDASWMRSFSKFTAKMWDTYRAKFGPIYSGLDKKTHKRIYIGSPVPKPAAVQKSGAAVRPKPASKPKIDPAPHRAALRAMLRAPETKFPIAAYINVMGKSQKVRVTRADASGLDIRIQGNTFPLRWKDLADADLARVLAAARRDDAGTLFHAALLAASAGQPVLLEKISQRLAELDARKALELERALKSKR